MNFGHVSGEVVSVEKTEEMGMLGVFYSTQHWISGIVEGNRSCLSRKWF